MAKSSNFRTSVGRRDIISRAKHYVILASSNPMSVALGANIKTSHSITY